MRRLLVSLLAVITLSASFVTAATGAQAGGTRPKALPPSASVEGMAQLQVPLGTVAPLVSDALSRSAQLEDLLPEGFALRPSKAVAYQVGEYLIVSVPAPSTQPHSAGFFSFAYSSGRLVSSTQVLFVSTSDSEGAVIRFDDGVLVSSEFVRTGAQSATPSPMSDDPVEDFWQCVLSQLPSYARDWVTAACAAACAVGGPIGCLSCLVVMGGMYAIAALACA